jgi:hypothetical protein
MRRETQIRGYGDGRTGTENRIIGEAFLRLLAAVCACLRQRGPTEFLAGDVAMRMKHRGRGAARSEVFWGGLRPQMNADFRRSNRAMRLRDCYVLLAPSRTEGKAHAFLLPAGILAELLDAWAAARGTTQEHFHFRVIERDGGRRYVLRAYGEERDVTEWHMLFTVAGA